MVKFKDTNKGRIGQLFANPNVIYKDRGGVHSGIDSIAGWNKPVYADNTGLVYKTISSSQSKENWQGVYQLVHDKGDMYVEVCQGHFNTILVKEGDIVLEGQKWGLEGNKGFVFSGGVQITPAMQKAGSQKGAHTHTSYRPVLKVSKTRKGAYYLQTTKGTNFKDKEGFYYEITHKDNGTNGTVDPYNYKYKNSMSEDVFVAYKLLVKYKK